MLCNRLNRALFFLFILSFQILKTQLPSVDSHPHRALHISLSTIHKWLKTSLFVCYWHIDWLIECDEDLLLTAAALHSIPLCAAFCYRSYVLLLNLVYRALSNDFVFSRLLGNISPIISTCSLPRKVLTAVPGVAYDPNPPIVRALVRATTLRTFRIFNSIVELEREVLDSIASQRGAEGQDLVEPKYTESHLQRSRYLSQRAKERVCWNDTMKEFQRFCSKCESFRTIGCGLSCSDDFDWALYKGDCKQRHAWGQYFRSNLDWCWDLAGSLKRLYRLHRKKQARTIVHSGQRIRTVPACPESPNDEHFPRTSTSPSLTTIHNGKLTAVVNVSDGPVQEVQVVYMSPIGETMSETTFIARG